jgi:adenylylsulfate kinase-like enzyme
MIVWIIGLSGAGKTTLASEVVARVRKEQKNVVLIDGDMVREVFGNDLGFSRQDRLTNAKRICQLGKLLDDQGIHVVCAILSLFPETRDWNRENLRNYYEVFIDTPMQDLMNRDSKGIYSRFWKGEVRDVAGMDIDFPRPVNADLIINNTNSRDQLLSHAQAIAEKMMGKRQ